MSRLSFSDSFSKSNHGKDKNFKGDRFGILFDGRSIDHGHGDTNDAASGRLNILRNGLLKINTEQIKDPDINKDPVRC